MRMPHELHRHLHFRGLDIVAPITCMFEPDGVSFTTKISLKKRGQL